MADHFNILDRAGATLGTASGYVTTGNVTATNVGSTWTQVGALAFSIGAAVGDYVMFVPTVMTTSTSDTHYDVAVKVGANFVHYASTGTGTPATEGDPGLYQDPQTYRTGGGGVMDLVVEAGHLSGGTVTFAMVFKGAGTTRILYASTDFPFRWRAINFGAT